MSGTLSKRLLKIVSCVYLAAEESVADDISDACRRAAAVVNAAPPQPRKD